MNMIKMKENTCGRQKYSGNPTPKGIAKSIVDPTKRGSDLKSPGGYQAAHIALLQPVIGAMKFEHLKRGAGSDRGGAVVRNGYSIAGECS